MTDADDTPKSDDLDERFVPRRELTAMFKTQDTKIVAAIMLGQGLARIPFHFGTANVALGTAVAIAAKLAGSRLF